MVYHIYYIKLALQFADMQIQELVTEFNHQVGINAWSDRALLMSSSVEASTSLPY